MHDPRRTLVPFVLAMLLLVAACGTTAPERPPGRAGGDRLRLSGSGVGTFAFGRSLDDVVGGVTDRLGRPDDTVRPTRYHRVGGTWLADRTDALSPAWHYPVLSVRCWQSLCLVFGGRSESALALRGWELAARNRWSGARSDSTAPAVALSTTGIGLGDSWTSLHAAYPGTSVNGGEGNTLTVSGAAWHGIYDGVGAWRLRPVGPSSPDHGSPGRHRHPALRRRRARARLLLSFPGPPSVDGARRPDGNWMPGAEEAPMSWNLRGSYVETCSCELMCPCNLSFDHGATYDFCRVTLVFDIREGEIDGTDIGGPQGRRDRRHAEGHDRRQLAARGVRRRAGDATSSSTSWSQVFGGQLGGPMAALAPLVGEMLGVERARDRGRRRRPACTASASATRSTSRSRTSCRSASRPGEPVRFDGMFHPVGSNLTMAEAKRSRINAFGIEYEGKTGLSTVRLLLGRLSAMSASGDRNGPRGRVSRRRSPPAAPGSGSSPCCSPSPASAGGGRPTDARHGRRAVDRARYARLVPRRLGRDDGRDDVSVGRADGRAVLAHDKQRVSARRRCCSPPAISSTWAGAGVVAFAVATRS